MLVVSIVGVINADHFVVGVHKKEPGTFCPHGAVLRWTKTLPPANWPNLPKFNSLFIWLNGLHLQHRKARKLSYKYICGNSSGLPERFGFGRLKPVNPPNLQALRQGDADAWDEAFRWLWPTLLAVTQHKLSQILPQDVEDVAIEAFEELVPKVHKVKVVEELKPLAASITHNRAVSVLRAHFAAKRGAGQTQSFESLKGTTEDSSEAAVAESPLDGLDQAELSGLISHLLTYFHPEQRAILNDFFFDGLRHDQIASKHGLAIGTVGVYLKRGLEAVRRAVARQPKLLKELEAFLR